MIFEDAVTSTLLEIVLFHNRTINILALILGHVGILLWTWSLDSALPWKFTNEIDKLEIAITSIPGVILVMLALPSLRLLYLIEETEVPGVTIKLVGHQWFWSYDYGTAVGLEFDSFIIQEGEERIRLLDVDNRIVLPTGVQIRLIVTSRDVLHSWTLPRTGLKADAVPGRLNSLTTTFHKNGVYYGQCSEICGANHSFMPIVVETLNPYNWVDWAIYTRTHKS